MTAVRAEAWRRLLDRLGGERDGGPERYEEIRRRLIALFTWRGQAEPERLADLTMDRVADKLLGGEEIRAEDPYRYFAGVARHVLAEVIRQESKRRRAVADASRLADDGDGDDDVAARQRRLDALDACLDRLGGDARALLLEYHRGGGADRIARRQTLADSLGIEVNALRIRVFRLRARVAACLGEMDPRT